MEEEEDDKNEAVQAEDEVVAAVAVVVSVKMIASEAVSIQQAHRNFLSQERHHRLHISFLLLLLRLGAIWAVFVFLLSVLVLSFVLLLLLHHYSNNKRMIEDIAGIQMMVVEVRSVMMAMGGQIRQVVLHSLPHHHQ